IGVGIFPGNGEVAAPSTKGFGELHPVVGACRKTGGELLPEVEPLPKSLLGLERLAGAAQQVPHTVAAAGEVGSVVGGRGILLGQLFPEVAGFSQADERGRFLPEVELQFAEKTVNPREI